MQSEKSARSPLISIVIPLYNEAENVAPLLSRLRTAIDVLDRPVEIILVNDGSGDETEIRIASGIAGDPRFRLVSLRRNFGQTAALMAGFDHASGDILVSMDGDLQNDPDDVAALIAKLDEGYDVVSGWRKDRQDAAMSRRLPSVIANRLISWISGVSLHDYGCTLKAYRRDVLEDVRLYGEMHRFVPIYASWQGGRVAELVVKHHPRTAGRSKYGLERTFKVILDLMLVKFLGTYSTKPIYVFGICGLISFAVSFIAIGYALFLKYAEDVALILTPLPLLATMAFLSGVLCILMGLIAELLVRVYYETQQKKTYVVKSRLNFPA
ncbi:MAG: glycosyltransferase family 2 protein [Pseudorhodoplanes sp.]